MNTVSFHSLSFCHRSCNHACISMPFTTCGPRIGSAGRSRYLPCHWAATLNFGGMVPLSSVCYCHTNTSWHWCTTWLPDQDERQQWCQLYTLCWCYMLWVLLNFMAFIIVPVLNVKESQINSVVSFVASGFLNLFIPFLFLSYNFFNFSVLFIKHHRFS